MTDDANVDRVFCRAVEITSDAERKAAASPIFLEFPERRDEALTFLNKPLLEMPPEYQSLRIVMMCLLGDTASARDACERLLQSGPVVKKDRIRFLAGQISAQDYLNSVAENRGSRCVAHYYVYVALKLLGQNDRERAKEHFEEILKSPRAPGGVHRLAVTILSRMKEDDSWPHRSVDRPQESGQLEE